MASLPFDARWTPYDRDPATRGGEILGLHKAILVVSALVALWAVLFEVSCADQRLATILLPN
jgi:hypothetical protein